MFGLFVVLLIVFPEIGCLQGSQRIEGEQIIHHFPDVASPGLPVGSLWSPCGLPVGSLWAPCGGLPAASLLPPCGLPVASLCVALLCLLLLCLRSLLWFVLLCFA